MDWVITVISGLSAEGAKQMWGCDFVFRTNLLTNDDLVDVIELVSAPVEIMHITIKWLKLWTSWDRDVESLSTVSREE
jgi:hypothetical protein